MLKTRNLILLGLFLSFISFASWTQVDIFTEDFQSGIPSTWGLRNFDGQIPDSSVSEYTEAWISKSAPDSLANLTASSTSFFSPIGVANRWLISPAITLGSYGNILSWKARSHDASYPDDYLILLSKTDTLISSFTDTVGLIFGEYVNWSSRSANLSTLGLDNETIYLAFVLQTNDGFKLYIDDVKVRKEDPVGVLEIDKNIVNTILVENNIYQLTGDFDTVEGKVFNSSGQLELNFGNKIIDLTGKTPGVYFVQVMTNKGLLFSKIVLL